jgi:hypothetical protein
MRYIVFDSFSEEVEDTDDLDHAKRRADANDGWVEENHRVIYDSDNRED